MKKINFLVFILGIFLLGSCEYNSTDDLTEVIPPDQTVDFKTYIKPVVDGSCVSCHAQPPNSGAPMSLITYASVRNAVENLELIERISLPEGHDLLMPQGGRLPQATIDRFTAWKDGGFIE